jgi:hypothetical protein
VLGLGGLASVTSGTGTTSPPPVQVNLGQCTGIKIFVIGIGCTDPNTTTTVAPTTSTTAGLLGGLLNTVTSVVKGLGL